MFMNILNLFTLLLMLLVKYIQKKEILELSFYPSVYKILNL